MPGLENVEDVYGPFVGELYVKAADFYVTLVKKGYPDEAAEFAEWFLETFDIDLES